MRVSSTGLLAAGTCHNIGDFSVIFTNFLGPQTRRDSSYTPARLEFGPSALSSNQNI